jgi:hypothetical protein
MHAGVAVGVLQQRGDDTRRARLIGMAVEQAVERVFSSPQRPDMIGAQLGAVFVGMRRWRGNLPRSVSALSSPADVSSSARSS